MKKNVWNSRTYIFENGKYLASTMDDSAIIWDEVMDADNKTKTIPTNFNEKKVTCKTQDFCILLAILLITITLLIAVSVCCYLIKYQAKQKYLLPFHDTKLKQVNMNNIN